MNEPTKFVAGNTVIWNESFGDYPATEWTLSYEFRGPDKFTVTATASGSDYAVTITAADSAKFVAGTYQYNAYVTKAAERYLVSSGTLTIEKNFATLGDSFEARSHARIMVDTLEDYIETYAKNPYRELTIRNRMKSSWSLAELTQALQFYRAEVRREEEAERIAKGLGRRKILVRLSPTS